MCETESRSSAAANIRRMSFRFRPQTRSFFLHFTLFGHLCNVVELTTTSFFMSLSSFVFLSVFIWNARRRKVNLWAWRSRWFVTRVSGWKSAYSEMFDIVFFFFFIFISIVHIHIHSLWLFNSPSERKKSELATNWSITCKISRRFISKIVHIAPERNLFAFSYHLKYGDLVDLRLYSDCRPQRPPSDTIANTEALALLGNSINFAFHHLKK